MPVRTKVVSFFRSLFGQPRLDRELDEELRGFLDEVSERKVRGGMTPRQARREAMLEVEGMEQLKEDVRAARIGAGFAEAVRDVRYGWLSLRAAPGFTFVAVLTLALGIGAGTAVFSVVHAVLLRSLPFDDPDRIVRLWQRDLTNNIERDDVSVTNFLDWQERSRAFEEIALSEPYGYEYLVEDRPIEIHSQRVSKGFFRTFGVQALHGRTFVDAEYDESLSAEFRPSYASVCVLSHRLWQTVFGGDLAMIGRAVELDGRPMTVVGVMPPDFEPQLYSTAHASPPRELYTPRSYQPGERRNRANYRKAVARLKPGVTLDRARSEMEAIAAQLAEEFPETNSGVGAAIVPILEQLQGRIRPALLMLFGAVGFVLLISCANVANLLLVRGFRRAQELAVRAAIGADRKRLLRQLLTESALLAGMGCVGGVLLAFGGLRLILSLSPADIPRMDQAALNSTVLGFSMLAALATALLFGLLPALRQSRIELRNGLSRGPIDSGGGWTQRAVIAAQVAFVLPLLVGAGLLLRSFWGLIQVDPGFAEENVVALQVHVWGKIRTEAERLTYFNEALDRILALPSVSVAGVSTTLPLFEPSIEIERTIEIEGAPASVGRDAAAEWTTASSGYFHALGVELLRGRLFEPADTIDSRRVAVVNRTMAERFWPGEDPIGRRFTFRDYREQVQHEIVGVVADLLHAGHDSAPKPEFFIPHTQNADGSMTFVVRSKGDAAGTLRAIDAALFELRGDVPVYLRVVLSDLVAESLSERRFSLYLLGMLAALALLLTAIGLYGVVSYSTVQRTKEIGLRIALGAQSAEIWGLVVRQGLGSVAAGGALGFLLAFLLRQSVRAMLFGVEPFDPTTYAGVAILLLAVTALACVIPAARAAGLDPTEALRCD